MSLAGSAPLPGPVISIFFLLQSFSSFFDLFISSLRTLGSSRPIPKHSKATTQTPPFKIRFVHGGAVEGGFSCLGFARRRRVAVPSQAPPSSSVLPAAPAHARASRSVGSASRAPTTAARGPSSPGRTSRAWRGLEGAPRSPLARTLPGALRMLTVSHVSACALSLPLTAAGRSRAGNGRRPSA